MMTVIGLLLLITRYAERLPIGTEAVIRSVSSEVVKGFFDRWYRPELMAVSVVGDLENEGSSATLMIFVKQHTYIHARVPLALLCSF
jgi:hypothetical protein